MEDVRVALLSIWFLLVVSLLIYYFVRELIDRYGKKPVKSPIREGKIIYDGKVITDYNRL